MFSAYSMRSHIVYIVLIFHFVSFGCHCENSVSTAVHCVFIRQEKNFSGLHRNSARQVLRFKILLYVMIIFIMNVLLYSFNLSRNVNGLTSVVTTNRSIQKSLTL